VNLYAVFFVVVFLCVCDIFAAPVPFTCIALKRAAS